MRLLHLITLCASVLVTGCVTPPSPNQMKQLAERSRWELAHWGSHAIPYGNDGEPVILAFKDGRVSGHAGCNRYSAGITFGPKAGDVTVSHGITTRMACEPRRMEFESALIQAFEGSARCRLEGESLFFENDIAPPLEFYRRPLNR